MWPEPQECLPRRGHPAQVKLHSGDTENKVSKVNGLLRKALPTGEVWNRPVHLLRLFCLTSFGDEGVPRRGLSLTLSAAAAAEMGGQRTVSVQCHQRFQFPVCFISASDGPHLGLKSRNTAFPGVSRAGEPMRRGLCWLGRGEEERGEVASEALHRGTVGFRLSPWSTHSMSSINY